MNCIALDLHIRIELNLRIGIDADLSACAGFGSLFTANECQAHAEDASAEREHLARVIGTALAEVRQSLYALNE